MHFYTFLCTQGVASGVLSAPDPCKAVEWYRKALDLQDKLSSIRRELEQQLCDQDRESPHDANNNMLAGGAAEVAVGVLFNEALRLSGPIVEETDSAVASAAGEKRTEPACCLQTS